MKKISILLAFLVVLISFALVLTSCGSSSSEDPSNVKFASITELSSIEVELAWSENFDIGSVWDLLFKEVYAAPLPPEAQPHYILRLSFNHSDMTITDVYKSFYGLDSSEMKISELTRDSATYNKFKEYLENRTVLCKVKDSEGLDGPGQAIIKFIKLDGSSYWSYFFDDIMSDNGTYELCSENFSNYIESLMLNR